MALNGTLSDLGIVDLIQFPHAGRKTGELIIAGVSEEARLYYVNGALTHVRMGEVAGMEALVEIVSWREGAFEFRLDVTQAARTIELDLHRTLMLALKTRDERAEEVRKNRQVSKRPSLPAKVQEILEALVADQPHVRSACILSSGGEPLMQVQAEEGAACFDTAAKKLVEIFTMPPRPGLTRVFFEDDEGIVHAVRLDDDAIAVLAANKGASLGAVAVVMNRLIAAIGELSV